MRLIDEDSPGQAKRHGSLRPGEPGTGRGRVAPPWSWLQAFWRDEIGSLLTSEYLILGTLLTLGLVAGISATRNSLVSEFEDYAAAILGLNTGGLAGTSEVVFDGGEEGTYTVSP